MNAIQIREVEKITCTLDPEGVSFRDNAIVAARRVTGVRDDESQRLATEAIRSLKAITKAVEVGRATAKTPILEIGRQIDGLAKDFSAPVLAEIERLDRALTAHVVEQRRIAAAAEAARLEEIRRVEAARKAAEEEARRQAEAIARAEAERAAAEEAARNATNRAERAKAEFLAREARENAEREQAKAEAARRMAAEAEARRVAAENTIIQAPVRSTGMRVEESWRFEVLNATMVYWAHPELCTVTVSASAVNRAIKDGMRECPGLRIWNETNVTAR